MSASSVFDEVKSRWRRAGLSVRSGIDREALNAFELKYGVAFPESFSSFIMSVDGMNPEDYDDLLIRFWPLSEVVPASEFSDEVAGGVWGYFVFADYSLCAHGYAIRLMRGAVHDVVIVGGRALISVAASFDEFLEKYLTDPDALFPTG